MQQRPGTRERPGFRGENGTPGRARTCDPRLRRPDVGSVIPRRLYLTEGHRFTRNSPKPGRVAYSTKYHIWYRLPVVVWTVETLNDTVDAELEALSVDLRARFVRIAQLVEAVGLPHIGAPHVKHISGAIWEIRLKGKSGIARALYVAVKPQRVVVLRVFVKKTQKTPPRELRLARKRAKEVTE
jgi:phage-related protein